MSPFQSLAVLALMVIGAWLAGQIADALTAPRADEEHQDT